MSQQRMRKSGGVAVEPARGRQSVVKASGDSMPSNVQAKQPTVRSTSKTKIPKSLRYDLENALVGLCDVWFGEIKPHLVRNNIKVHVHGGGAGPASGDHQRLPPGAPGCSHLDPGAAPDRYQLAPANSADYCSTQPTASRARCRKPPVLGRPACPPQVSSPAELQASLLNPCRNYEAKIPRKPVARRHPRPQPQPQPPPPPPKPKPKPQDLRTWRTPRLCRTYSIITPRTNPPERRLHTADAKMSRWNQSKRRRPKMVDKSTQTPALRRPVIIPYWEEESWRQDLLRQYLSRQEEPHRQKQFEQKPEPSKQEPSRPKGTLPSCLRCPATTNMQRGRKQPPPPLTPLFKDDLINIIAEKNDKQLRVLFRSPTRSEQVSSMDLLHLRSARHSPPRKTPWK